MSALPQPTRIPATPCRQIDPSELARLQASMDDLAVALRRLTDYQPVSALPQSYRDIVGQIEGAMIAMIRAMPADAGILSQCLHTGSTRLCNELFALHGPDIYRASFKQAGLSFRLAIRHGRVDLLRIFLQEGFDLANESHKILKYILRNQDVGLLRFLRAEMRVTKRFSDVLDLDEVLGPLPPFLAVEIAAECRESLGRDALDTTSRRLAARGRAMPLKYLAALMLSGHNPQALLGSIWPPQPTNALAALLHKTQSNHGHLALHALEPSLEDVLMRPLDGIFFGLTQAEAQDMMDAWSGLTA